MSQGAIVRIDRQNYLAKNLGSSDQSRDQGLYWTHTKIFNYLFLNFLSVRTI